MISSTLAIVGSRSFNDLVLGYKVTDDFVEELANDGYQVTKIVSGGAEGADLFGRKFAKARRLKLTEHYPQWNVLGKRAGMVRNKDIIDEADFALVFWDGESKGTKNAMEHILNKGIRHTVVFYEDLRDDDERDGDIYNEWS